MNRLKFFFILLALVLSGCFREDIPLPAYQPNPTVKQVTIPLASPDEQTGQPVFRNQVFFEMETGLMHTIARESWDLGFETGSNGYRVILNSANFMQAANLGQVPFDTVFSEGDMAALSFDFDPSHGDLDSTVIGEWLDRESGLSKGDLYMIDRGFDGSVEAQGFVKLQFTGLGGDSIAFVYSDLDNQNKKEGVVYVGDTRQNFVCFSLEDHKVVEVQPEKDDWDLLFSYYSYRYPDGYPYWLTGALTNRQGVSSAEVNDSSTVFAELSLADTSRFEFTQDIDQIGFDWKTYLFGPPARYVVDSSRIFLLKDQRGIFYKLRFLDFYNEKGERGFPTFEYAEL